MLSVHFHRTAMEEHDELETLRVWRVLVSETLRTVLATKFHHDLAT